MGGIHLHAMGAILFMCLAGALGRAPRCSSVRNVEVLVQLPIYSKPEETFFSHVAVQNFFVNLHNARKKCWMVRTFYTFFFQARSDFYPGTIFFFKILNFLCTPYSSETSAS